MKIYIFETTTQMIVGRRVGFKFWGYSENRRPSGMWIFYPHNGCSEVANTFLRKDILVQKLGVVLVNDWNSPYHAYESLNNSLDDHTKVYKGGVT